MKRPRTTGEREGSLTAFAGGSIGEREGSGMVLVGARMGERVGSGILGVCGVGGIASAGLAGSADSAGSTEMLSEESWREAETMEEASREDCVLEGRKYWSRLRLVSTSFSRAGSPAFSVVCGPAGV